MINVANLDVQDNQEKNGCGGFIKTMAVGCLGWILVFFILGLVGAGVAYVQDKKFQAELEREQKELEAQRAAEETSEEKPEG